jgi:xylan 1,4-beta-xylosidase
MTVEGIGASSARLRHFRIDAEHSNAYTAWLRMGSPATPSPAQYAALERASDLAELQPPSSVAVADGRAAMHFILPRQAVSLAVLEW